MRCPFPGMDPWLEHPSLWPDVHNSLISAIRDELAPRVAPRYYIALERRTYHLTPDDLVFVGRPDLTVVRAKVREPRSRYAAGGGARVVEVAVPVADEVQECYLEVRDVETGRLVTLLELLSPANKVHTKGREDYLEKRTEVFATRTNLIEVDLLRAGDPMPMVGKIPSTDYRILIRRGHQHRKAHMHVFSLRDAIPSMGVPLAPEDEEPELELGKVLHALYERARFDLRLRYDQDPVPPLDADDRRWADDVVRQP